jgi:glycosyltransferase involved in cell wall biosynthesis
MRLLYISNEYPPDTGFGGIATYTKNMAEGMSSFGHDVHVICRSVTGTERFGIENGVSVHRIGPGRYTLPSSDAFYLFRKVCRGLAPQSLVRLAWAKEAFLAYQRLISQSTGFDIIEYPECGGEGYYFKDEEKTASIARLHTPWELVASLDVIREKPVDRILLSHLDRASVRAARGVSSPTLSLAGIIEKRWHIAPVAVFPNPIPADRFPLSDGKDWIYTGRVERRKGVHVLVQAYADLRRNVALPPLRIIGRPYGAMDGIDYGDYIDGLIKSNGLSGVIEWIRGADHDSVKRYLALSSVAIFPSFWENLSYGCLEAMACGCAVVASRCGGFPEIIRHGENGFLFPPGDPAELSRLLYKLHTERGIARAAGDAARVTVRKTCDTKVVCGLAQQWYRTVCNRERT